jgi:hypothetical protein
VHHECMSTEASEPEYDFDVALSFAGEDRAYVEDVARELSARDIKHFYDEDHLAEMWGENLYEFLDEVYRKRARYAVLFVSRHYAEKAWPRRERQSAQARAVEEKMAYVLPVRLDDTELPGLLPSISYLDARRIGITGIVEALLQKLAGHRPCLAESPVEWDGKVPRSHEQMERLLADRPPGWEYLLFGFYLLNGRASLEDKYRDHEVGHAVRGPHLTAGDTAPFLSESFGQARSITSQLEPLLSSAAQKAAFGKPGEAGEPARIEHMARRLMGLYEECLDWATRLRGTTTSEEEFSHALQLASRFMDAPIEEFRSLVDRAVANLDRIPGAVANDEPFALSLEVTLTIPDGLVAEFSEEMDRLGIEYG